MKDKDKIKSGPRVALTTLYQRAVGTEEISVDVSHAWEMTFKSINEMVSIHDKDFNLVHVNDAFSETLKKRGSELIGKKCYEVIHGEYVGPLQGHWGMQSLRRELPGI